MGAASAVGMGRFAINKAVDYVKTRQVWKTPIGAHQGLSHPLAQNHIEIELAKLMMQKAATLYDSGDDVGAAEAANMAKYAAGEASVRAVDQAVQSLGGNGLTKEYGIAAVLTASQAGPHRPGQPRDGPQLRGADLAGSATLVLMSTLVHYSVEGAGRAARRWTRRTTATRCPRRWSTSCTRACATPPRTPRCGRWCSGHTGGTFCAGADLAEAGGPAMRRRLAVDRARELTHLLRAILELPLPVIAAIDGHVRAGGLGLVGACDIVGRRAAPARSR